MVGASRMDWMSAWWPMHLTLAKYMHVYVIDRLATQVVAVHHDAKAFLATLLVGQALGCLLYTSDAADE